MGRNRRRSSQFTKLAILKHWLPYLDECGKVDQLLLWSVKGKIDLGLRDGPDGELVVDHHSIPLFCFACTMTFGRLDRAHILPLCEGGEDVLENVHLLCGVCHRHSEHLSGEVYWDWFKRVNIDSVVMAVLSRNGLTAREIGKLNEGVVLPSVLDWAKKRGIQLPECVLAAAV